MYKNKLLPYFKKCFLFDGPTMNIMNSIHDMIYYYRNRYNIWEMGVKPMHKFLPMAFQWQKSNILNLN